jgi:hypothetical protein
VKDECTRRHLLFTLKIFLALSIRTTMVRLFETRRAYNARMKRRSNLLTSNANIVKLIKEYRNLQNQINRWIPASNRSRLYQTSRNTRYALVKRADKLISNSGVNAQRNFPLNNSFHIRLRKILAAVPNTRNRKVRTPKYVLVNQPNGNKGLGRVN